MISAENTGLEARCNMAQQQDEIRLIDAHVHVSEKPGTLRRGPDCFCTPEELIGRYDEIGVEKGVLQPLVSPESYLPQSNEEILAICREHPERFIPFCNVDPRVATTVPPVSLGEILEHYRDAGCCGIGEVMPNLDFRNRKMRDLFAAAEELKMPLCFHIAPQPEDAYGVYDEPGLPGLQRALESYPSLVFLGHSQAFWAEMAPLRMPGDRYGYPDYPVEKEGVIPRMMRRYPNLYGDLSAGSGYYALTRDPDYAVEFIEEFQDRLLFGTDICAPDTETPLVGFLRGLLSENRISPKAYRKIARENIIELLNL